MATRWPFWIEVLAWLGAAVACWHFLKVWNAPGTCNSSGRAFDYAQWVCGDAIHYPYRDVPVSTHPSFWWFVATLAIAILVRAIRWRRANLTNAWSGREN
jgi:hypothetical protein